MTTPDAKFLLIGHPYSFTMTLVRFAMPYYDCVQRPPGFVRSALQETAKQANVADNFVDVMTLKIPVRHRMEVDFDLLAKIAGHPLRDCLAQIFSLNVALFEEIFRISQIARGCLVKLPHERFFPIRPVLAPGSLPVRQRQQHQRIQILLSSDKLGKISDRRRIIQVSALSYLR